MKKLLLIAFLMLALVITAVACTEDPVEPGTSAEDVTTAETPTTEAPDEPDTPAPDTNEPETPAPDTDEPETPAPDTDEPETPAPDTDEPETPAETEPPVDPADPVWIVGAEQLNELANVAGASNTSAELKDGYISLTAKGGDPWFMVAGNLGEMPEYLVIRYRTNASQGGEFFIGNGTGPVGGESFLFNYNANGEWNLLIFHLPTVASYMATPTVGYIRYDFYTGGADEGFLDVEYIAFFNTAEYAQAYDFELHKAPHWTEATDQVKHQSFDQLYAGTGNADNGPENIFTPGASADWDFVVDYSDIAYADFTVDTLTYWGWIGFMGEKGQFGYQIDMNPAVYNDEWAFVGGDHEGIIGAAQGVGADSGHRMKIAISIAGLEGEHTVRAMYKTADGVEICLNEFTVKLPARPTHYDNYNVPQDLWTVTGHCPGIVGKEGHANSGMVAAGGVESGALVHQGAVALGEIDLSKYDKAVIMWGCDNSPVTVGHYEQSANNRIMLVSADVNGTAPAEETIIAGGTYELGGWAVQAFEIDLTEVDYNGPVYLCIDTLPGTFALFASVEFIGGEIDYSHKHSYETVVTAPTCTEAGFTTYTCSCGDTYVADEVAALGHDIVTDAAVDATCTEAGLTAGEHCSRCDHKVAQEEIPAKGHAYDENGICSACDHQIAVVPKVGKGYVFGMLQGNLNKVYYLKGGMDGYYMATTTDPAQAILVFIEETEGGYHFYTIQNGAKKYINMVVSGTHVNGQYASAATTVYTIDETSKTLVATVNGAPYWFGTRNDKTYTTMGPCKTSYKGFYGEFYFAHSHNFEVSETVEATCEGEGYTEYVCSCGDSHRENVVAALGHSFTEGTCTVCGAADPDYVAPEDPDQPAGPVIGSADFNTIVTTNPNGDSSYTKTFTTEAGWVITNSAIQAGGATNMNPQYTVIGPDNTYKAVCLNGKVSAPGKLTSPTLSGGLTKLTLTYTKIFTDLKLGVTVTVTELSGGTVYTHVIERDVEKDTDKYVVWTDEWVLETPVVGDYTIEIVNNCPSGLDSNKDRMTILSLVWEGAAPEQGGEDIPHEHSYTAEVTAPTCTVPGFTTYTCACGDTYTADETAVVPHVDTDLDITCDFEGCTKRILPAADSEISLFTANKMIIVSLSSSYYMQGVVTEVTDAKNGVFVIRDEAGDTILVRLPKNAEGASHSTWEQKIVVGDTVRVYGQPKQNTGSSAGQKAKVEGGILTIVSSHDHVFSEATCLDNGVCFCGKVGTPALGHADEDASGFCDRCDWNMNLKIETVVTRTDDGSAVVDEAKTSSVWTGTEFTVTVNKAGGSMLYTTAKDHMRFYKNNELVIASVNGKVMQTVTIVTTNATQMANMEKLLTGLTYTKDEAKFTLTIEHNSAEALTIANSGTSTIQFKAFEIVYE